MGTTRDALEAGPTKWAWVVAIEGYDHLLTSHHDAMAVALAWVGTDWSSVTRGLSVDLQLQQSLNPDEPIGDMGTCRLWVVKDGTDDSFGIATHRRGGAGTYLEETLDRTATTVTVKSTAFAPDAGVIHIGTEAIAYGSKTATTFEECERGLFAPAGAAGGARFARDHSVTLDENNIKLQPKVTLTPRWWKGRFVSVYMHRVVGGVLDVRAEAECVYAGTIGEIRDDQNTGATVVEVRSIAEWMGQRVLGANLWQGKLEDGVTLSAGSVFKWHEQAFEPITHSYFNNVADNLEVVASGAAGPNQINAGRYTLGELCNAINQWLAAETAAVRLYGTYSMASPVTTSTGLRTKITYSLAGEPGGFWNFTMPAGIAVFFGFDAHTKASTSDSGHTDLIIYDLGSGKIYQDPSKEPYRLIAPMSGSLTGTVRISTTNGELEDQYTWLPGAIRPASQQISGNPGFAYSWGLFVIGDEQTILAAFDPADPTYLTGIRPWIGSPFRRGMFGLLTYEMLTFSASESPRIRQIMAFERDQQTTLLTMAASTGTPGYNDAFFDVLPSSLSVGVPLEWIGDEFASELPNNGESSVIVIEKPTKFADVVASDLVIRFAFLKWERGGLRFGAWQSPTALAAELGIGQATKAEPSGVQASQRASSNQTDEFQKSIIKVETNRSFAKLDDEYTSYVMFADRVAAEDEGGASKVHTISMANTFDELTSTGASIEALLPPFLARMPMISRAAWLVECSVNPATFWKLTVGKIVAFTDPHARNPTTGQRGVTDRPALVLRLSFSTGGMLPGSKAPMPMGGRVVVFFTDTDPDKTGALYAPAANVDATANPSGFSNGYNHGDKTLRTVPHAYSNADEDLDAESFTATREVLIVERDPYDPDNPITWRRTVAFCSGTDVVLETALSAPAWDPSREYVVLFADYADVITAQHAFAFQADDATGLIQGDSEPYLYGSANPDPDADDNDDTEPELPCNRISGDGAGRCSYGDTQLIRLVDNFIDYRSAQRDGLLLDTPVSNLDVTGGDKKLVAFWPVYLSRELLTNAIFRYITCAPWAGSTDGTPTSLRIRLCRERPTVTSLVNYSPIGPYAEAEWTGITNATLTTLDERTTLTVNTKNGFIGGFWGEAWVTLELGYKCTTRGIAAWAEGARQAA